MWQVFSDIATAAPETAVGAAPAVDASAEGDFVPNNELGQLLGFNLKSIAIHATVAIHADMGALSVVTSLLQS